jgi:hypothetical protein
MILLKFQNWEEIKFSLNLSSHSILKILYVRKILSWIFQVFFSFIMKCFFLSKTIVKKLSEDPFEFPGKTRNKKEICHIFYLLWENFLFSFFLSRLRILIRKIFFCLTARLRWIVFESQKYLINVYHVWWSGKPLMSTMCCQFLMKYFRYSELSVGWVWME